MFTRHFILALFTFLLASLNANAQLTINEYSAANWNQFADNFLGHEDWIEVYNSSDSEVSLVGYYFSDDASKPTKWQVPAIATKAVVPAKGYFTLWCSGADTVVGGGVSLHAGFKFTQAKSGKAEHIVFANAAGSIIDDIKLTKTQSQQSVGRTQDGASTWGIFTVPTPTSRTTPRWRMQILRINPTWIWPLDFTRTPLR